MMKKGLIACVILGIVLIFQQESNGFFGRKKRLPAQPIRNNIHDSATEDTINQTNTKDTIKTKIQKDTTLNRANDTLPGTVRQDSIQQDTIPAVKPPADTIVNDTITEDTITKQIMQDTTGLSGRDTVPGEMQEDTLLTTLADSIPEDTTLKFLKFEPQTKVDSAVAYWNKYGIKDTASTLSDSIKKRIQKFLYYAKAHPVDSTMNFIRNFLDHTSDSTFRAFRDSSMFMVNDTLYQYLNYLWNTTKKDSLQFTILNSDNDSLNVWLTPKPGDSTRFILYDSKDYPGGIWITPKSKQALKLSFDEDTRIIETKSQETLKEILPIEMKEYGLQQQEEINMIFPDWDLDGITNAHFSQGYLSNWTRGGESSLNALWSVRYSADYTLGDKISWDNDLEYKVGLLKSGKKKLRKNEDKLEINSKLGSNAINNWYYSSLLNFQTQFFTGYNYPNTEDPISGFLAPAHLVFSIGMDYKPSNKLTVLLSPVSSKFTMMRDTVKFDQTNFGIPGNEKVKKELGAYLKSIFTINFNQRISMENKVNFFINYLEKNETMDIDYEFTINMEVTELINTTINAHLIYDKDVSKKIQFKENLSVGLSYKF
jgi:hypothetical protein